MLYSSYPPPPATKTWRSRKITFDSVSHECEHEVFGFPFPSARHTDHTWSCVSRNASATQFLPSIRITIDECTAQEVTGRSDIVEIWVIICWTTLAFKGFLYFPKQRLRLRNLCIIKACDCVTEFRIRCPDFASRILPPDFAPRILPLWPSSEAVARILSPGFGPRILPPCVGFSPSSESVARTPGVQLRCTFGSPFWGHLSPIKGPDPFWTLKRERETGDPFGIMVALLSAAAKCFRAWVSVEIPWRSATKHKHGLTCAAGLFYLRHVRSCAAPAFWKSIHVFRNGMRHMGDRGLGDTENHNGMLRWLFRSHDSMDARRWGTVVT